MYRGGYIARLYVCFGEMGNSLDMVFSMTRKQYGE
jgi:hypothetical protein